MLQIRTIGDFPDQERSASSAHRHSQSSRVRFPPAWMFTFGSSGMHCLPAGRSDTVLRPTLSSTEEAGCQRH